ncbi:MAG: helix-turn-helix domain-containing protein [Bacteroidota bacterium]
MAAERLKKENDKIALISLKLKEMRIKRGYSSYERFATENEIDRKQYWRMENGANITLKSLIKILNIHKVSMKEFFNMIE